MELRLPCIKPLTLYSADGKRSIKRSYKSDARGVKQVFVSWHCNTCWSDRAGSILRLYMWLSYRRDKQRRSQRPWNGYHNLSLQWVIAMSYSFHKHGNWYCYNHSDWYWCGHWYQYHSSQDQLIKWNVTWWTKFAGCDWLESMIWRLYTPQSEKNVMWLLNP